MGLLFETSTASVRYVSSSLGLWTSCIALPPRTYDGLTTIGKPIISAFSRASVIFLTVAFDGCFKLSLVTNSWKRSLSSDLSIASTSVPRIFTPFSERISANLRGV